MNILTIQSKGAPSFVACENCEADLTEYAVSKAIVCDRFAVVCASPCGLAGKALETGTPGNCLNRTEPDEWHQISA